jgi:hypothetical protein
MTVASALVFEEGPGYALCRYGGAFRTPDLVDAAERITAFCSGHRYARVLVDLRASTGDLTVEDRYIVANNISYTAPVSLRVAICIRADQGDAENTWTSVMSAHGFAAQAFAEPEAAAKWLLTQPT